MQGSQNQKDIEYKLGFAEGSFLIKEVRGADERSVTLQAPKEMYSVQMCDSIPHLMDGAEKLQCCKDYFVATPTPPAGGPLGFSGRAKATVK